MPSRYKRYALPQGQDQYDSLYPDLQEPEQLPDAPEKEPEEFGFWDYVADTGRGAVNGAISATENILSLPADIANAGKWAYDQVTEEDLSKDEDYYFKKLVLPKLHASKTGWGQFVKNATQFAVGFAVGGVPLKLFGMGARIKNITKGGRLLYETTRGAMADIMAYDAHEQRLSNLIEQYPALSNPITEYLSANDEDSPLHGRLKNAIEGAALGSVGDLLFAGIRKLKVLRNAKNGIDANPAMKEKIAQEAEARLKQIDEELIAETPMEKADLMKALDQQGDVNMTVGKTQEALLREQMHKAAPVDDTDVATVAGKIGPRIAEDLKAGRSVEEVADEAGMNIDRWIDDDARKAHESIWASLKESFDKESAGDLLDSNYRSLKWAERFGKSLSIFPDTLKRRVKETAERSHELAPMLVAGRITAQRLLKSKVYKNALKVQANGSQQAVKDLTQGVAEFLDFSKYFLKVQHDVAYATTAGNIKTAPSYKAVEKTLKGLEDMTRTGETEKLAYTIAMSGGDFNQMNKLIGLADQRLSGKLLRIHNELWVNALLSGVRTQVVNTMGNVYHTVIKPAHMWVGGALAGDRKVRQQAVSTAIGLRMATFDTIRFGKMGLNLGPSLRKSIDAYKKGVSAIDPAHTKLNREMLGRRPEALSNTTLGDALGWLRDKANIPTKFLGGMDTYFKEINYRASVYAKAVQDFDPKKSRQQFEEFLSERLEKAFDASGRATDQDALEYARSITWTSDLPKDSVGRRAQQFFSHPVLWQFAPFVRTPMNILYHTWDHLPGLQYLRKDFRDQLAKGGAVAAEARGRQAMGYALMSAAGCLASEGRITGGGPKSAGQRDMKYQTGWQPYSVVIDKEDGTKEYIQYNRLDPLGMFLGLVADIAEISGEAEERDLSEIMGGLGLAISKNLTSKTYLAGIADALEALNRSDEKLGWWVNRRLASYVPSIVRDVNHAFDDQELKEVRGIVDAVRSRIPGLSDEVSPRRNLYGEKVLATHGYRWNTLNPATYSRNDNDLVDREMAALEHGFSNPAPEKVGVDMRAFKGKNGQDAYDRWLELIGQEKVGGMDLRQSLKELFESDYYKELSNVSFTEQDSPRVKAVKDILREYRAYAFERMTKEYPELREAIRLRVMAEELQ